MNSLNAPNQNAEIITLEVKKARANYTLSMENTLNSDTNRQELKGWKRIYKANSNNNQARVAILIYEKINFKTRNST